MNTFAQLYSEHVCHIESVAQHYQMTARYCSNTLMYIIRKQSQENMHADWSRIMFLWLDGDTELV